jgi:hypothetical protein
MSWRSRDCETRGTAVWTRLDGSLKDETNIARLEISEAS